MHEGLAAIALALIAVAFGSLIGGLALEAVRALQ